MHITNTVNWLAAAALALALAAANNLDGPSDHDAAIDQAASHKDAMRQAAAQHNSAKHAARQAKRINPATDLAINQGAHQ